MIKITTQFINKMIKFGYKELSYYIPGGKQWLLIYEQIIYLEELLND